MSKMGGPPVRSEPVALSRIVDVLGVRVAQQLQLLLQLKNGFYAFEAALHVLSDLGGDGETGLLDWNRKELWRNEYDGMADGAVFFAEDLFGTQFCLRQGEVATFDPETGKFEKAAVDIEEWAEKILDDYGFWTGCEVAHDWQAVNGPLAVGARLVPVHPFVLGGEYSVSNLRAVEAVQGMRYRASIAVQIRDLPDGMPISLRVIE